MAEPAAVDEPDEIARLRRDLAGALAAARDAESEAGALRGTIAELKTQLARARQDQEQFQRWVDARRRLVGELARVRRRLGRLRPRRPS